MPLFGTQFVNLSGDAAMKGIALGQQAAATGMEGKLKQQQLRQQQSQFDATSGLRAQQERLAQYQADAYGKRNQYIDQFQQLQISKGEAELDQFLALAPIARDQAAADLAADELDLNLRGAQAEEWIANADQRKQALDLGIQESQERLRQLEQQGRLLDEEVGFGTSPLARAIRYGAQALTRGQQELERGKLDYQRQELELQTGLLQDNYNLQKAQAGAALAEISGQAKWREMLGSGGGADYVASLSTAARDIIEPYLADLTQEGGIKDPAKLQEAGAALQAALAFDLAQNKFVYKEKAEGSFLEFQTRLASPYAANMPARAGELMEQADLAYQSGNYKTAHSLRVRANTIAREHNTVGRVFDQIQELAETFKTDKDGLPSQDFDEAEAQAWIASNVRYREGVTPAYAERLRARFIGQFGSKEAKRLIHAISPEFATGDDEVLPQSPWMQTNPNTVTGNEKGY
jgi:hypothetical protein